MFLASKGISALSCLNSRFVNPTYEAFVISVLFRSAAYFLPCLPSCSWETWLTHCQRTLKSWRLDLQTFCPRCLTCSTYVAKALDLVSLFTVDIQQITSAPIMFMFMNMLTFSSVLHLGKGGPSGKDFEQKRISDCQHYRRVTAHSAGGTPEVI